MVKVLKQMACRPEELMLQRYYLIFEITKPAKSDVLVCTAWSTHRTGRSSFVGADIHNSNGELVSMGQGTFRIIEVDLLKQ